MKTKKVLLATVDKHLSETIRISALTLTKLNCQVSIEECTIETDILKKSGEENLDLILLDKDLFPQEIHGIISEIRKNINSKNKKIILLYSDQIDKEKIFEAGCDSVMSKSEFVKVVNNILTI